MAKSSIQKVTVQNDKNEDPWTIADIVEASCPNSRAISYEQDDEFVIVHLLVIE